MHARARPRTGTGEAVVTSGPASRADVEALYRRHAGELRGYLYRRAGETGADLLEDVFVIAIKRVEELPAPDLHRAWLFGTARRLLLAADRETFQRQCAESERARLDGLTTETAQSGPSVRARAVRQALASLKEEDRELIRLTEWEQLTIIEAAMVLGIRSGTARVRLHRARRSLLAHPAFHDLFAPAAKTLEAPVTKGGRVGRGAS